MKLYRYSLRLTGEKLFENIANLDKTDHEVGPAPNC